MKDAERMEHVTIDRVALQGSHPLAQALITRLCDIAQPSVLEIGIGQGRNTRALLDSGFAVVAIDDDPVLTSHAATSFAGSRARFRTSVYTRIEGDTLAFDGALSTHGMLHGTPANIGRSLLQIARLLKTDAPFYATFGSTQDSRYGKGRMIAEGVYASEGGDESGVAHAYFEEKRLRQLLEPRYVIESLDEVPADGIAGRWAHSQPLHGSMHWFVRARAA